jgi:predicted transposase/invertase (TIGR01784 family)
MNEIKNCSLETKRKIAYELYKFHKEVKSELESLEKNGILKSSEVEFLMNTFYNLEKYISEKDKDVKEVVDTMGDVDYIAWSDRIEARGKKAGIEEGKKAGIEEGKKAGIKEARNEAKEEARKSAKRLLKKGLSIDDIAECLPQLSYDELRQIEAEVMTLA